MQTEEKFDKILELVGPATLKNSFDHIQSAGIICNTGQLGSKWGLAFLKLVKAQFPQNRVVGTVRSLAKKDLLQYLGF